MKRIALLFAVLSAASTVGLAQPTSASAGWCWPACTGNGILGPGYVSGNGCWYYAGEVCSGWTNWYLLGVYKTCYPMCNEYNATTGKILYGYENHERIRGNFTIYTGKRYVQPVDLGMGGYLRAQVSWWSGSASQINTAAAG
jgi:hypothetical protein